jgi:hypothetical protein
MTVCTSPKHDPQNPRKCHACQNREWYRSHRHRLCGQPSPAADYPREKLRWDKAAAEDAYDATPAAAWAMLFWDRVSMRLGRSGSATHRKLHFLWGWPAKVDPALRVTGARKPRLDP